MPSTIIFVIDITQTQVNIIITDFRYGATI